MNKKFLKVFLFCAVLLGVSGGFVSCSDDYDDDIDALNTQTSSLSSQLSTLESALSTAQSTASAAQTAAANAQAEAEEAAALATQAASEAKAAAIEAAIAEVETLLASTPTQSDLDALATQISAIDADLVTIDATVEENSAAIAALETQMDAVKAYLGLLDDSGTSDAGTTADLESAITAIEDAISALENKVGSVEDTLESISDQIAAISGNLVTIQGDQLRSLVFIPTLYVDGVEASSYQISALGYLTGAKGGESGTDNEGATYKFASSAVTSFSESSGVSVIASIGTLQYHVNPTSADLSDVTWDFDELDSRFVVTRSANAGWEATVVGTPTKKDGILTVNYTIDNPAALLEGDSISVLSLQATLANDTTVNSDYAAIYPDTVGLKAIAYKSSTKITTSDVDPYCALDNELWLSAKEAAENVHSIEVAYNGGPVDLTEYLNIHYTLSDASCSIMTLSELAEDWGLTLTFEEVPYTLGNNGTVETAYCTLTEEGIFTPAYVDENGGSIEIEGPSTSTTGISSVGRLPIVLVTAVNEAGKVALRGYIKIKIVKEATVSVDQTLEKIISTGTFPFTCTTDSLEVTWAQVSSNIYEWLQMDKDYFADYYRPDGLTYWKSNGVFVEAPKDSDGKYLYGDVTENTDQTMTSTTNLIKWTGDADQKASIVTLTDRTVTLYAKYINRNNSNDVIYFGMTITIGELPEVTFATRIDGYWYPASKTLAERDTVRMNVPYPSDTNDVKKYVKDLDSYYLGDQLTFTFTKTVEGFSKDSVYYAYEFDTTQPTIGNYTLSTDATKTQLLATGKCSVDGLSYTNHVIATLDQSTGEVTYVNDDNVSEEILNLYSHYEPYCYAKINIAAYYGYCLRPLNNEGFNLRFLRPIDILEGDNANFVDAAANGSTVAIADLFSLKDWREMPVLTSAYPNGYVENGVNLYDYYQFQTITIDIDNATCDLAISSGILKLSDVTKELNFKVTDANGDALSSNTVSISTVSELQNVYITYYNNSGNVQQFNVWIPITIEYSWGTLNGQISAVVAKTIAN